MCVSSTSRKFSKKNIKTRLIHISTDEVFGDIIRGRSDEKAAYKPSSPYAASKASSYHLVYYYIRLLVDQNEILFSKSNFFTKC